MKFLSCLVIWVTLGFRHTDSFGHHKHGKHSHLNIHVPKYLHHDFHTKHIVIHHHHHIPKKEHHHHNIMIHGHGPPTIHHAPPAPPHHHDYHHKYHTVETKGSHGHSKHKHHTVHQEGHHSPPRHFIYHNGHGGPDKTHYHTHHLFRPTPPTQTYHEDQHSHEEMPVYSPPVPSIITGPPTIPKVHGFKQTVNQVKVFDSDPQAGLPQGGYEVTEASDDDDGDQFTSINGIKNSFPATYNYIRNAAPELNQEQPAFAPSAQEVAPVSGGDEFIPFTPILQEQPQNDQRNQPEEEEESPQEESEDPADTFGGQDLRDFFSNDNFIEDGPGVFERTAGFQQNFQTNDQKTIEY